MSIKWVNFLVHIAGIQQGSSLSAGDEALFFSLRRELWSTCVTLYIVMGKVT